LLLHTRSPPPPCCHSASNYLLGLTPLPLGPYLLGTVAGMTVWASLYASLGGASRALLRQGVDLEVLLAGEAEQGREVRDDSRTGPGGCGCMVPEAWNGVLSVLTT
jgi:hypothetical protein